jgi:hypothetical protein
MHAGNCKYRGAACKYRGAASAMQWYNRRLRGVYTMMQKLAYTARLTYQAATNRGCHTLLTDHTG